VTVTEKTWPVADLLALAAALLEKSGLDHAKAETVAELLVEADLMGHDTHGLALLPRYLEEIAAGAMTIEGEPHVIRDTGSCITWDGRRLPGVWLVAMALDLALDRAMIHGVATAVIRNSHHIGCLAAYLPRATERGYMLIISSTDPSNASVAPFGGTQAVCTPNPVAVGIPTGADPILIDTSASITTNNLVARVAREGGRLPAPWLISPTGEASDEPAVLKDGGALLPAGGLDHGQKGYAWALIAEALTQGLSGFGRADAPRGWGGSVFLQVLDPQAFAGSAAFERQTGHLAAACRASRPRPGAPNVRLPGESGLARKRRALEKGLALQPSIMTGLQHWAQRLDVPPLL